MTDGHRLAHVDADGKAHMVDVTSKERTYRVAEARCFVQTVANQNHQFVLATNESDLLWWARYTGVLAAKQTATLIPLCHSIRVDSVEVDVTSLPNGFAIVAVATILEKTGVEMEALTACTAAALVIVQAVWTVDPLASMEDLAVWSKSGGRSGTWTREPDE
jgi:cyclic pyranopterin monophosphate synthase